MRKIFITVFILCTLFILYGFYINPKCLKTKEYTIENTKITEGFNGLKIVHLSDLLFGSPTTTDDLKKITDKINQTNADIIFFTGDLIKKNYSLKEEKLNDLINFLNNLKCNLYKYAVIGDSDNYNITLYKEIINGSDFTLLDDTYTYLFYKDINPIKIIGLTDPNNQKNLYTNEEGITPSYTILLTHYPDNTLELNESVDLILAGHSEGGRINLPFMGGIIKKEKAKTYFDTYYQINDTDLYISNGIGTEGNGFRIFNTPTINIYKLKTKQS